MLPYNFDWVEDSIMSQLWVSVPSVEGIIALKNLPFTPSSHKLWLKLIYAPITENAITLGLNGDNELRGFVQIGIYQKIGTGEKETKAMMKELNNAFSVPMQLNAPPGCLLRLDSKGSSAGGQTSINDFTTGGREEVWNANYLTVYWLAREPR